MEINAEQRLDILKTEMGLIQGVFNKYDEMITQSRNWFITLWMATMGLGFTVKVPIIILFAAFLAALYWILEGLIRHQYWYKYVVRYRAIRDELNRFPRNNIEGLSLYDLTHHYGISPSEWKRIWGSFFKLEPFILYLALGFAAVVIWRMVETSVIVLPAQGICESMYFDVD